MGVFDKESGGLDFPPKVGQSKVIKLVGVERVTSPGSKDNYKAKVGSNKVFDYHDILITETGKMLCNAWKLYFAIKDSGVDIGDTIEINHKGTGEYIVTKIKELISETPFKKEDWN